MKIRAYTVYDEKTLSFNPPFFAATDGAATRSFQELANDLNTNVGKYPADFKLYYIGDYDIDKGAMLPIAPVAHVVDALALVAVRPRLPIDVPETGKGEND